MYKNIWVRYPTRGRSGAPDNNLVDNREYREHGGMCRITVWVERPQQIKHVL